MQAIWKNSCIDRQVRYSTLNFICSFVFIRFMWDTINITNVIPIDVYVLTGGDPVMRKKTGSLPRTVSGNIPSLTEAADRTQASHVEVSQYSDEVWLRGSQQLDLSDTQDLDSLSSTSTSDTQSVHPTSEERKASAATTVLRPRFGKEYKKLDRKKLVEELNNLGLGSPKTPNSPHNTEASVFTFDVSSTSSQMSGLSGFSGDGESWSPSIASVSRYSSQSKEHDYVNIGMPRELSDSPRFMEMTPPGSPRSLSSEQSNPMLNYAEIDLSKASSERKPPQKSVSRSSDIEYAMIDMVATAAAQRVGKEHAQRREQDSLRRKEKRMIASDEGETVASSGSRRVKDRKSTSSVSLSRKGSSRSQSGGSRDRKFSSPM